MNTQSLVQELRARLERTVRDPEFCLLEKPLPLLVSLAIHDVLYPFDHRFRIGFYHGNPVARRVAILTEAIRRVVVTG